MWELGCSVQGGSYNLTPSCWYHKIGLIKTEQNFFQGKKCLRETGGGGLFTVRVFVLSLVFIFRLPTCRLQMTTFGDLSSGSPAISDMQIAFGAIFNISPVKINRLTGVRCVSGCFSHNIFSSPAEIRRLACEAEISSTSQASWPVLSAWVDYESAMHVPAAMSQVCQQHMRTRA